MSWIIFFGAVLVSMGIYLAKENKDHESCKTEEEWDGTTEIEVSYQVNDEEPVTFKNWYGKK